MGHPVTALTPAQVREHARALIEQHGNEASRWINTLLRRQPGFSAMTEDEYTAVWRAIADAIRTARITVDWDEETA